MRLDRSLQVNILEYLATFPTRTASRADWNALIELAVGDEDTLVENLYYLEGHEFIESGAVTPSSPEPMISIAKLRITKDGQDFLLKDGGLTAIKKNITVRFHAESISLIEAALLNSPLSHQEKTSAVTRLKELPFVAIEHLTKKLVDLGLENLPGALQLIQSALR